MSVNIITLLQCTKRILFNCCLTEEDCWFSFNSFGEAQIPLVVSCHDTRSTTCRVSRDVTCRVVRAAPCLFQHDGDEEAVVLACNSKTISFFIIIYYFSSQMKLIR